ncbi:type VI secretion system tip protein VgrG, partial [Stutzerimonas nitrititolerans]
VTLNGATIRINSGGAPGSGSGARPILPGQARLADTDKAGNLLERHPPQDISRLAPPAGICVECLHKAIREQTAILSGEQP